MVNAVRVIKKRLSYSAFHLLLYIVFVISATGAAYAGEPIVVGIVVDGKSSLTERYLLEVSAELKDLLYEDYPVVFKRLPSFSAHWDVSRATQALKAALADPETDIVLCAGILTTLAGGSFDERLQKPVIGGFYLDSEFLRLPVSAQGDSLKENFTFIAIPGRILSDLKAFARLLDSGPVYIALDEALFRGIADLEDKIDGLAREVGLELRLVPMGTDADSFLSLLPANSRAVYLTPPLRMEKEQWQKVIDGLAERKVFTFSFRGEQDVRLGVLAGNTPDLRKRLSRRIALHIRMILDGTPPSELPVGIPLSEVFFLNMKTASRINWSPPFDLMLQAVLVDRHDSISQGDHLTIRDAMEMAIKNNPSRAVAEAASIVAEESVGIAKSGLLPQVSSDASWVRIDRERAEASLGIFPMRTFSVGVALEQAIFDDSIISRYRQARRALESSLLEQEAVIQDIMLEAGLRYLALLSAEALYRIELENLTLTQRNLELARLRRQIGVAGPEEVFRFESLLSEVRGNVIGRKSQVRNAVTGLNRSMGMDQSAEWMTVPMSKEMAIELFLGEKFINLVQNMESFDRLSAFSIDVAMERLRIRSMEMHIEAQKIEVGRLERRFYLPKVGGSAHYERRLSEDRPAADIPLPGGISGFDLDPGRDDWSLGIKISFPLFEGGRRVKELSAAKAELKGLRAELDRFKQISEQEVRDQLNALYYSYPNIKLTRVSAEMARENLNVVRDKYARGAVSILDLLDAQTQAIAREQAASVAVFAMVSDLLRYQRAISWMGILRTQEEKADFREKMEKFLSSEKQVGFTNENH